MTTERKFQPKTTIVLTVLLLMLAVVSPLPAASANETVREVAITVNGEPLQMEEPVLLKDGRLFVPAVRVAQRFGAAVTWDKDHEEMTIQSSYGDTIIFGNGVPVVYFNDGRYMMDALPFFKDGRMYAPLRQLTELLHGRLTIEPNTGAIELTSVPLAEMTEEDSLDTISAQFGLSRTELIHRNGLAESANKQAVSVSANASDNDGAALAAGTKLKVVIPSVFKDEAKPFTDEEWTLLAKITMVEAGYESYEGQLAVANVIVNRVNDARFPSSIRDVIYSGRQFPPAHNGLLDRSKPHATAMRAAKDALNGKNNVEGAVYFHNPRVSRGSFWSSLDTVATIGNHRFAK